MMLGWMVCQTMRHRPLWSGMWLKGGIGTKICALDPFLQIYALLLLDPFMSYEYPLPHPPLECFNLAVDSGMMSQQRQHFGNLLVVQ